MSNIKAYMLWFYSIAVPLLIACLYRVPIDFITSTAWLAAFVYIVFSFIVLLISLYRCYIKRSLLKIKMPHMLRPILCLIAFIFAREMVFLSTVSANEKALNLAVEMKSYVSKNGACKIADDEWEKPQHYPPHRSSIKYGNYGTKYYISYVCEPESKEFSYSVRMNKDADFRIKHFENGKFQLKFGHYSNVKTILIDQNTNLLKLARMEIKDDEI